MKVKIGGLLVLLLTLVSLSATADAQQKKPDSIAPAEKPADGQWDEIDQRLVFLMVRLANLEASLDAVENAIGKTTGKRTSNLSAAKRAEAGNELMDRKAGGPMKWSEFYGRTAEKFFYHPVDPNTSYHTDTLLTQRGPQADNKVGGGVPASQGLPVHQRPPQFDYIYRANENAKARAEQDAAELKGKVEALLERRQRLEVEQAGLWCEVAFRAVSHYDLDKKPLYRFEPLLVNADAESRQHAETMKVAASFMRVSLSIIDEAQNDQAATFNKIKPAVSNARQKLNDAFLRLAVDATDRKTAEGRFAMLAKRLDDVASNLSDSFMVANEGDQAKDRQRKDTFRALLQESLVGYAQIILALDEMSVLMKEEWKIKPDPDKPIQFVSLSSVEAVRPVVPRSDAPRPQSVSVPIVTGTNTDVKGVIEPGNVALLTKGTKVDRSDKDPVLNMLVDGIVAPHTKGTMVSGNSKNPVVNGRVEESVGSKPPVQTDIRTPWTITFVKVYRLKRIKMQLYLEPNRFYKYKIESSLDGTTFDDFLEQEGNGWQVLDFPARPIKALRITPLADSKFPESRPYMHVFELQAYCK